MILTGVNYNAPLASFPSSQITRIYHTSAQGIPASVEDDPVVLDALQSGLRVIVSFKPAVPATTAQQQDFQSWCNSVEAAGYAGDVYATVWHEPWAGDKFPDGAAFVSEYMAFQPYAEAAGINFGPILNTYPYWNHAEVLSDWMPADDAFSYIGIDVYAGDNPSGGFWENPLAVISPFTHYAKSRGKVFGIAEIGVPSASYGAPETDADAVAWVEDVKNLGSSARFVSWFQCPPGEACPGQPDINANGGVLIPAWQNVVAALSSRQ